MRIKSGIEILIKNVEGEVKEFNDKKTKLEASTVYSAEFIHDEVRKLEQALLANIHEFNVMLRIIFQKQVNVIRSKKIEGDNFELKLSNVLGFINVLGDNLKDEAAFTMVQPFFGDYATMHNLSLALSGRQGIPATLFTLSGYDNAINMLKNMEIKYKTVFNDFYKLSSSLESNVIRKYLIAEVDEYENFIIRLNKYFSASAHEAEKIIADHSRFEFGLSGFTGVADTGISSSRTYREMIAK